MSRALLGLALMVASAFLLFIMASPGPAASVKECADALPLCLGTCPTFHPDVYRQCQADCINRYSQCVAGNPLPGSTRAGDAQPPSTTGTPPKRPGLREPIGVSGDKQVGSGTRPKGKVGLGQVDVGGLKDPGTGTSLPPKGKVGLDKVNVGGMSSGPTSGGTTTIQRSQSGKKH